MSYRIHIKRPAEKELDSLSTQLRSRIISRLLTLEINPRPVGVKKLQGEEAYRLRVGDYRVLYTIDDAEMLVPSMPLLTDARSIANPESR
jgi:mRNA interferase RelE/StbE